MNVCLASNLRYIVHLTSGLIRHTYKNLIVDFLFILTKENRPHINAQHSVTEITQSRKNKSSYKMIDRKREMKTKRF